jgi:flagellar basal body rod protein FlgG
MGGIQSALATARTGADAFARGHAVNAQNIANLNSDGYRRHQRVYEDANPGVKVSLSQAAEALAERPDGLPANDVDLVREMANEISDVVLYRANLSVIRASDQMLRESLSISA